MRSASRAHSPLVSPLGRRLEESFAIAAALRYRESDLQRHRSWLPRMRILVASHTYIVDLNCEKLRVLACLEPEIEVTVVVPRRWCPGGVQNTIVEAQPRQDGSFRVIPISNFSKNNQGLLTFGGDIIPL